MDRALDQCAIVVVLLGRNAFPDDKAWRVEEVARALNTGKRILPVLLDGAVMPRAAELPESIRKLIEYQPVKLYADRLDADLEHLLDIIGQEISGKGGTR
jgi:hypothetical protein